MSHAIVTVLVPADTDDIGAKVAELMAPYDENARVEPYKVRLDDADRASMADHYETGSADPAALLPHVEAWSGYEGGIDEDGLYYLSTYNPLSKWDWWQIGGRYHGRLPNDACPVAEIPPDYVTLAILTPDGAWHERGRLGWFGMVHDEKEASRWEAERAELYSGYNRCIAVVVDYHI